MTVAGYSGDAGNALRGLTAPHYNSHGNRFTTKDRDNDGADQNCAVELFGGWWYNDCARGRLNRQNALARWTDSSENDVPTDVQASRMLVKIK